MARSFAQRKPKLAVVPTAPIRLDIGSGPNKKPGFHGVDIIPFVGVDTVLDVRTTPWPWADGSVGEVHSSHFVEHLTGSERIGFVNELWRVMAVGAKALIVVPHWASCRAYGDPTHQWPPVSEFWFYYLSRAWRAQNAPHTDAHHWPQGYACDFEVSWGYSLRGDLMVRNEEYRQFAMANYKEVLEDTIATLTKRAQL